jgi:hypothetical protein
MVLFLLLHAWVPLGPFNDLNGVNSQIPFKRKVLETAINTVPVSVFFPGPDSRVSPRGS